MCPGIPQLVKVPVIEILSRWMTLPIVPLVRRYIHRPSVYLKVGTKYIMYTLNGSMDVPK